MNSRHVARLIHLLTKCEDGFGHFLSWALLIVVLLQIADRFLFEGRLQLAWTEELARILLVWFAFWGALLVQREKSHIRMDLLVSYLPSRPRVILNTIVNVFTIGLLSVIGWYGSAYTIHEFALRLPATGIARSVFVLAVTTSSLLMMLHTLLDLVATRPESAVIAGNEK